MKPFIKAVLGVGHTVIYTDADGKHFRFSGGTLAWRNHNPGNLKFEHITKQYHQIGFGYKNLAIFPTDQWGHEALLDDLHIRYGNYSIHDMIYSFAPPTDGNPTAKYERYLHKATGIYDETLIKNFTPEQFENLWKAIEHFEDYKAGSVIQVYPVTAIKKENRSLSQLCLDDSKWVTHDECIMLAKQGILELEACNSQNRNTYLRSPPNSLFQKRLEDLPCEKN